jgi:hypothetical protein
LHNELFRLLYPKMAENAFSAEEVQGDISFNIINLPLSLTKNPGKFTVGGDVPRL